jgi:hypothetical protein
MFQEDKKRETINQYCSNVQVDILLGKQNPEDNILQQHTKNNHLMIQPHIPAYNIVKDIEFESRW